MKELIKKYKLSYEFAGSCIKWEATRYQFKIKVGKKTFDFFDSVHNFDKNIKTLSDVDLLLAFRSVTSDALAGSEYLDDKAGFLNEFGFLDPKYNVVVTRPSFAFELLTTEELQLFKNGEAALNGCKASFKKLGLTDDELVIILDELSTNEIE